VSPLRDRRGREEYQVGRQEYLFEMTGSASNRITRTGDGKIVDGGREKFVRTIADIGGEFLPPDLPTPARR